MRGTLPAHSARNQPQPRRPTARPTARRSGRRARNGRRDRGAGGGAGSPGLELLRQLCLAGPSLPSAGQAAAAACMHVMSGGRGEWGTG